MKEKIVNALKNKYSNLGLGEKAFNGVASFLEKTITDESDIENAIAGEDVKALITSIQAETDSIRNAKSNIQKEYEAYKSQHPSTEDPGSREDDEVKTMLEQQKQDILNLKKELEKARAKDHRDSILKEVRTKMKANGSISDPILDLVLGEAVVSEGDTVDGLAEKYKTSYDENYRKFYGNGVVPPKGGHVDEGYKPGAFADKVKMLKEQGMIPDNK